MSEFTTREGVAGQIVAIFLLVCIIILTGTTKVSSPAQLEVWS